MMERYDQFLRKMQQYLNIDGGIASAKDVPFVLQHMRTALEVPVCLSVLSATEQNISQGFLELGGWSLLNDWLSDAVVDNDPHALEEMLKLYYQLPVSVTLLRQTDCGRTMRNLMNSNGIDDEFSRVRRLATDLVTDWKNLVKRQHLTKTTAETAGGKRPEKRPNAESSVNQNNVKVATDAVDADIVAPTPSLHDILQPSRSRPKTVKTVGNQMRSTGLEQAPPPPPKRPRAAIASEKMTNALQKKKAADPVTDGSEMRKGGRAPPAAGGSWIAPSVKRAAASSPADDDDDDNLPLVRPDVNGLAAERRASSPPDFVADDASSRPIGISDTEAAADKANLLQRRGSGTAQTLKQPPPAVTRITESTLFMDALSANSGGGQLIRRKKKPAVLPGIANAAAPATAAVPSPPVTSGLLPGLADASHPLFPAAPLSSAPSSSPSASSTSQSEPLPSVSGALSTPTLPKKSVRWRADVELTQVFYFELDETERANVSKISYDEMRRLEHQREKEAVSRSHSLTGMDGSSPSDDSAVLGGVRSAADRLRRRPAEGAASSKPKASLLGDGRGNKTGWRRPALIDDLPLVIERGLQSVERDVQTRREQQVLQAVYFSRQTIPDSAAEPDAEPQMFGAAEPKIIPLTMASEEADAPAADARWSPMVVDELPAPRPPPLLAAAPPMLTPQPRPALLPPPLAAPVALAPGAATSLIPRLAAATSVAVPEPNDRLLPHVNLVDTLFNKTTVDSSSRAPVGLFDAPSAVGLTDLGGRTPARSVNGHMDVDLSPGGATAAPSYGPTTPSRQGRWGQKPCTFYQQPGGCQDGDRCHFAHVGDKLSPPRADALLASPPPVYDYDPVRGAAQPLLPLPSPAAPYDRFYAPPTMPPLVPSRPLLGNAPPATFNYNHKSIATPASNLSANSSSYW